MLKKYKPSPLSAKQKLEAVALYRARHNLYQLSDDIDLVFSAVDIIEDTIKHDDIKKLSDRVKILRFTLCELFDPLFSMIDKIDNIEE